MDWIDIIEREPEKGQKVLVKAQWLEREVSAGEAHVIALVEFETAGRSDLINCDTYAMCVVNITHWLPIPE